MFHYPDIDLSSLRQLPVWLLVMGVAAAGFHYLKGFIVFLLEKLYEMFIQQHPPQL